MRNFVTILLIFWSPVFANTDECLDSSDPTGENYTGKVHRSLSGRRCRKWGRRQPRSFKNYCRKISGKDKPGCMIRRKRGGRKLFEYCDIPICAEQVRTECVVDTNISFDTCGKSSCLEFSRSGKQTAFSRHKLDGTLIDHEFSRKRRSSYYYESDYASYATASPARKEIPHIKPFPNSHNTTGTLGRVVNGEEADISSYPWQVALRLSDDPDGVICGGTIVDPNWVVTAAHCVYDLQSAREMFISVGHTPSQRHDASKGNLYEERHLEKIFVHKRWDEQEVIKDIALLKLSLPLVYNANVKPICLPRAGFDINNALPAEDEKQGPVCIISGWGDTKGTADENHLQQATLPIITNDECNARLWEGAVPDEFNICAGYKNGGIDTCQGDSGGPMICKVDDSWTLVGITSWGMGCAEKTPGVYSRVIKFKPWMTAVMKHCSLNTRGKQCKGRARIIYSTDEYQH